MSAVLVEARGETGGQFRLEHLTADAAILRLAIASPIHGRACFTGCDLDRLRVNPGLLGDAVLVTAGNRGLAMSWTVRDPREGGAESLFVADLDGDAPTAVLEAVKELRAGARSRGVNGFVCCVPLEAGWLLETLRSAGLQLRSQEWLGGMAELRLDA